MKNGSAFKTVMPTSIKRDRDEECGPSHSSAGRASGVVGGPPSEVCAYVLRAPWNALLAFKSQSTGVDL